MIGFYDLVDVSYSRKEVLLNLTFPAPPYQGETHAVGSYL